MFDLIIVGGGPIGLYTAKLCEDMGYRVLVIEEHEEIGRPLHCSGLISKNIERFFPDIKEWDAVENEVNSAVIHSPKSEFVLRKRGTAAYVIDRERFDRRLGEMIRSKVLLGCRAGSVIVERRKVKVNTSKGEFEGEMVVGCDGANSIVAKGLCVRPREVIKGIIGIVREKAYSRRVDLYFDKERLRDGFFWRIPRGERLEYGMFGKGVKFEDLEKFFGLKEYEKHAGLIPIGPVRKSYFDRVLLVGDAAGQVKPWSGGGVIYGLTCAEIASRVIEKAFRFNDFSEGLLKEYEIRWKARIGKQIGLGLFLRRLLRISNNLQLDILFRAGRFIDFGWMDMDFIF